MRGVLPIVSACSRFTPGLPSSLFNVARSPVLAACQRGVNPSPLHLKLMAMAGKLEAQGAADRRKWKSKEEEWEKEREELLEATRRLQEEKGELTAELENKRKELSRSTDIPSKDDLRSGPSPLPSSPSPAHDEVISGTKSKDESASPKDVPDGLADDVLKSTSLDVLRAEIIRLRKSCREKGVALQDLKAEGHHIEQVMQSFGIIGKRIVGRVDSAVSEPVVG